MSTKPSIISYLEDQLASIPSVSTRKMFGGCALYCDGRVVALVCDDQLFVKITGPGKSFVGEYYQEGLAYPGAKPSMLINEERIENREWLAKLIRITADNVPLLKPQRKKQQRA